MLTKLSKYHYHTQARIVHRMLSAEFDLLIKYSAIRQMLQNDLAATYAANVKLGKKLTGEETATKAAFLPLALEYTIYKGDLVDMRYCFELHNHEVDSTTSVRHYLQGSSLFAGEQGRWVE